MNSFGLGQVWSTIQQAGTNLVAQFQAALTQLLFAGKEAINNAKPIFAQLIQDLKSHTGDAVSIVNQAISQLNQVLSQSGNHYFLRKNLNTLI